MNAPRLLSVLIVAAALFAGQLAGAADAATSGDAAVPALTAATPPPPAKSEKAAKGARQSAPNPLAPRFAQIRERIDALFHYRNDPPPPPDPRFNPFRLAGTAPPAPVAATPPVRPGGTPEPKPAANLGASNSLGILQQAVATLKVSGVFEIGGRSHLVINSRTYKEGDVLQTQVLGEAVYLRVREIGKRSVSLVLNDAEMTLKF